MMANPAVQGALRDKAPRSAPIVPINSLNSNSRLESVLHVTRE